VPKPKIPTESTHIRWPQALADLARKHAALLGMPLVEFVRSSVRMRCGLHYDPFTVPAERAPNEQLYRRCAFGDHLAMREMADRIIKDVATAEDDFTRLELFSLAVLLTRLAAEHGEGVDQGNLGALLVGRRELARTLGQTQFADQLHCEAIARFNLGADRGDRASEDVLAIAVQQATPELIELAKARGELIADQIPEPADKWEAGE
jgi:hypothetical protein